MSEVFDNSRLNLPDKLIPFVHDKEKLIEGFRGKYVMLPLKKSTLHEMSDLERNLYYMLREVTAKELYDGGGDYCKKHDRCLHPYEDCSECNIEFDDFEDFMRK